MERDFSWLWENLKEGARQKFEEICYDVYSSEFPNADVHQVEVVLGDGGVDIDIHEEDGESTVVQCKFFLNRLDASRKNQIRESFKTAVENNQMENWILCIPMDFSHDELKWWKLWKEKQKDTGIKIQLHDASKLMKLIKKHNLYEEYFKTIRLDNEFIKGIINNDEKNEIKKKILPVVKMLRSGNMYKEFFEITNLLLIDLEEDPFFDGNGFLVYLNELIWYISINNGVAKPNDYDSEILRFRRLVLEEYEKLEL
ncbi:restriction endonuclease [Lysinibacillus sp. NPDC093688]|uniref:restriction endonuclease n=1 Tax=Lysinibacillus sp. NPDC093688 TaxID=3390577 RepID=UPI003CFF02C2